MAWPVYPHGFLGPGLDEDPYLVERSLRFDGTASLNRTFGTPAFNSFEFSLSMWVKISSFGTARHLFGVGTNHFLGFNATDNLNLTFAGTSLLTTTAVFRDPSAWYHIVWRSQNATGAGQFLYVNNQLVGQGTGATNVNTLFNTAVAHRIGCSNTTTPANFFSGYLAEIIFGDEEVVTPGVFAEADSITGRWRPKPLNSNDAPFFADGNGFYLKFNDTASLTTLGYSSGNTNHWTLNNFSITAGSGNDSLVESPSDYNGNSDSGLGEQVRGNYCTLNPIDRLTTATLSNGALDFTTATTGHNAIGTFAMTTGKWYWEARTTAGTTQARATVHSLTAPSTYYSFAADNTDYGFRFDADAGTLDYTTNGTSWVSLATGLTSGPYFPFFNNNGTTSKTISANFGQRPFTYTAPSEYKVLCTTNLPTPTIRAPDSEMDVLTYAGDGTSKFLNASNFDVGMSWIKNRTTTSNHILTDVLRPNLFPIIKTDQSKFAEGSSSYFNGVDGNYLDMPLPSNFFSDDFTVEVWARVPNKDACTVINTDPHTIFAISLNYLSNQKINIAIGNGSSWLLVPFVASTTFTYNSWVHVAVVRNGGTITIYQDGVNVGSTTTMPSGNTNFLRIGAVTSISGFNNETYSGHMNGLRLVKSAIYTGNFTPPALSFTATSHSVATTTSTPALLLNMNGAENSTTFTDSSTNNATITAFGNAKLGTAIKKFGSGSGYFDGSGDYLGITSNAAFDFGTGDFTIEAWIYLNSIPLDYFISSGNNSGSLFFGFRFTGGSNQIGWGRAAIAWDYSTPSGIATGQWYHVAISRNGADMRLFVNGNQVGVTQTNSTAYNLSSGGLSIGAQNNFYFLDGYIDDLRITKGVARYTSNFTPPTSELPLPSSDPNGSNVSLLLRLNGEDGSTIFTDESYNNFTVSPFGNAMISGLRKKFGSNSAYFDGSGDYISGNLSFSYSSDFTIEGWFNRSGSGSGSGTARTIFQAGGIQVGVGGLHLHVDTSGVWYFNDGLNSAIIGGTSPIGTWVHFAAVRNGSTNSLYINGILIGTSTQTFPVSSTNFTIGGAPGYGFYAEGYVDDFRISRGALYIGNFTPPTQELTTSIAIPTTRILNMTGSDGSRNFIESSQAGVTVTPKPDAASLALSTNLISAEASTTSYIGAYPNTNKVFVTSDATLNANTNNYVNWRWKGGTQGGVTNTSGTITSQVSESEFGGLSIVTYTGTGANATIGHGLGATPAMILVKQRNSAVNGGAVYHRSVATPAGNFLRLFDTTSTNAATADNTVWNGASPTFNSTVFSVGTSVRTNASTGLYVAYCFSEVSGYSRFGSYVGNANANGPFVWCGFRPKWVLIKSSTAADAWLIYDYQRSLVNVAALNLVPNTTAADATISGIDFVANGFKLRTVTTTPNAAQTYVFAAFAESPFKYARAR